MVNSIQDIVNNINHKGPNIVSKKNYDRLLYLTVLGSLPNLSKKSNVNQVNIKITGVIMFLITATSRKTFLERTLN
jgi:hypothetical protein